MYRGEHEAAAAALARSRELSEQVGFREGVAWALHERGVLAVRRGEPGAAGLLHEALDIHRDLGDRWRVTSVLDDLAAAALAGRPPDPAGAARLLGAAQHIREAIGTAVAPCERADHARTEASARAALGGAAFAELARRARPGHWTTCWPVATPRVRGASPDAGTPASPHRFSAERTTPLTTTCSTAAVRGGGWSRGPGRPGARPGGPAAR
jgi:hypothetical protein